MSEIILHILETETLRSSVSIISSIIVVLLLYFIFIRKPFKSMLKSISTFGDLIQANNEITKTIAFMQLQETFYRTKEKGSKSVNEDERWQKLWKLYEQLGDGYGDTLKKEWQDIPIK